MTPHRTHPHRAYSRSPSPPVTVSSTSSVRPHARAAASAARTRASPQPPPTGRPADLHPGHVRPVRLVVGHGEQHRHRAEHLPGRPVLGDQDDPLASPAAASAVRQKVTAVARGKGSMNPMGTPPSTQSAVTAASASASSGTAGRIE